MQVGPLDQITSNANTSQLITLLTKPGQVPWVKRPRSDYGGGWLGEFLSPVRGLRYQIAGPKP